MRAGRPRGWSYWGYACRQLVGAGLDMLFPPHCGGCGRAVTRFCANCAEEVAYLSPPLCERCGYPVRGEAQVLCDACRQVVSPHFGTALNGVRSVGFFEGSLQRALHRLKYRRDVLLADSLARLLHSAWLSSGFPGQLVVAVPLSTQRLRERGYNQAELLACGFAALAGLEYTPRGLRRIRHSVSQVELDAEQRRANVRGAFQAAVRRIAGRALIVVDDVCTTGATLAACAEALRAAGAASVWGFTLARAR